MSGERMDAKSWRLLFLCLLALLYAFLVVLAVKPVLVYGCWYDGGMWDPFIPKFLQRCFDAVIWLRAWFWAVSTPFAVLAVLGWLGILDGAAKPLCGVVMTILLACVVFVFMVRGEVSQTSPLKRAMIETPD